MYFTTATILAPLLSFSLATPVIREPPTRVLPRDETSPVATVAAPVTEPTSWELGSCHASFQHYHSSLDGDVVNQWISPVTVLDAQGNTPTQSSQATGSSWEVGVGHDSAIKIHVDDLANEVWIWTDSLNVWPSLSLGYGEEKYGTAGAEDDRTEIHYVASPGSDVTKWRPVTDSDGHPDGATDVRQVVYVWDCGYGGSLCQGQCG